MKKKWWLLGVAVLSVAAFLTWWYSRPEKPSVSFQLLQQVPSGARMVMIADVKHIAGIIGKELFLHPDKMLELKDQLASEDQFDQIFDGLAGAGIKYQDKLIMYLNGKDSTDLTVVTMLGINNRNQFREFFNENLSEHLKGQADSVFLEHADLRILDSMNLAFAWNEHQLAALNFMPAVPKDSVIACAQRLFDPAFERMTADTNYRNFIEAPHEVAMWLEIERGVDPGLVTSGKKPFQALSLDFHFEEGQCRLDGKYHVKEGMSLADLPFRLDVPSRLPNDSSHFFARMALEPNDFVLNKENPVMLRVDSILGLNNFSTEELLESWTGYLDVEYHGVGTKVNEFVTIDFDDNFNEVRKVRKEEVPYARFTGSIGVSGRMDDVLNKLEAKKIITREKENYKMLDVLNAPVYIKKVDKYLLFTTEKEVEWEKDTTQRPVFAMEYDYARSSRDSAWVIGKNVWLDRFIRSNDQMDKISLEMYPDGESVNVNGLLKFKSGESNGLVQFLAILINMKTMHEADQSTATPLPTENHTN